MHRLWRTALGILTVLPLLSVLLVLLYFDLYPAAFEAVTSVGEISPTISVGPVWGLQAIKSRKLCNCVLSGTSDYAA